MMTWAKVRVAAIICAGVMLMGGGVVLRQTLASTEPSSVNSLILVAVGLGD